MAKFIFVVSLISITSFFFAPGRSVKLDASTSFLDNVDIFELDTILVVLVPCAAFFGFLVLVAMGPLELNPKVFVVLTGVVAKDTEANGLLVPAAGAGVDVLTVVAKDVLAKGLLLLLDALVGVKAATGALGMPADGVRNAAPFFHFLFAIRNTNELNTKTN